MSIPLAWPPVPDFFGTPLVLGVVTVYGLQPGKHGVATIAAGVRCVLGVPFHGYHCQIAELLAT